MPDLLPIKRALISVSDKDGLEPLTRKLHELGVEILSTGGTAKFIETLGITVTQVESVTGFPEILGGRVKTLHPNIHAGILADKDNPEHLAELEKHNIKAIDLVVVNLYPFEETVADESVTLPAAIEQIDIGGVALLRAAAKNHSSIAVLTDPELFPPFLDDLTDNDGSSTIEIRSELAAIAFNHTADYDDQIAGFLDEQTELSDEELAGDLDDEELTVGEEIEIDARLVNAIEADLVPARTLRYGENPHQEAIVFADVNAEGLSLALATELTDGKELSYNNLLDANSALNCVLDLGALGHGEAAVVVKHSNPCGAAIASTLEDAIVLAHAGDPLAAYGGIIAVSSTLTTQAAQAIVDHAGFIELVCAPDADDAAVELLHKKWKNIRVVAVGTDETLQSDTRSAMVRTILGGVLVQTPDELGADTDNWNHTAGPAPTADSQAHAALSWIVSKHLTSNAIAIAGVSLDGEPEGVRLFGAGAGQMDRVASCRIAIEKASANAAGAAAASDAFFPFPDGPQLLIDAGVSMLLHPGGSKRDQETFDLCDQTETTCLTTGTRHFRH